MKTKLYQAFLSSQGDSILVFIIHFIILARNTCIINKKIEEGVSYDPLCLNVPLPLTGTPRRTSSLFLNTPEIISVYFEG